MEGYLIILVIVLLIAYLITRNQARSGYGSGTGMGNEEPYYDDPDIQGQGSFGRNQGSNPLGRMMDRETTRPSASRRDNPNIQGRGSFGRNKR